MKRLTTIIPTCISTFISAVFLLISLFPQFAGAQTSINNIPPRGPQLSDPPPVSEVLQDVDPNIGANLVQGGRQAIEECVDQPLGEFSGILSSNMTAMATEFLGGADVVNEASQAVATAANIADAALGAAQVASKLAPLLGLPDVGSFLGGAESVRDDQTFKAKEIYEDILNDEKKNQMPIDVIENSIKKFGERLQKVDWQKYHSSLPFNESALALYEWSPIAEELKSLDKKIVLNSMILKWDNIKKEFFSLIKV